MPERKGAYSGLYLVDDTGTLTEIKDKAILNRIMEIEKLENQDKKPVIHVIDSLNRDQAGSAGT